MTHLKLIPSKQELIDSCSCVVVVVIGERRMIVSVAGMAVIVDGDVREARKKCCSSKLTNDDSVKMIKHGR